MNPILESLFSRRSVRAFAPIAVSHASKALLIESALTAPTAGGMTLYSIIDVTDDGLKKALSKTCDNQPFIAKAPVVLIFVADYLRWHRSFLLAGAQPRPLSAGDLMLAFSDACIAAQNVVVAAESLGLSSCYIGDILEQYETHRALLSLPDYCIPAAMLVIGHPAPGQRTRKKPIRVSRQYVVGENCYPTLSDEQLLACYHQRESESEKAVIKPFEGYMQAFCERKFNSDFAVEMNRSVARYLSDLGLQEVL